MPLTHPKVALIDLSPALTPIPKMSLTHDHGGVDIYIGQQPPPGQEHNWIRTLPDTGWFPTLRI